MGSILASPALSSAEFWAIAKNLLKTREKIDIIPNVADMREVIKKSLSPAEIIKVEVDDEVKSAIVYILPTQRAKAVWKNGLNVNLASKLTGYKISIEDVEME